MYIMGLWVFKVIKRTAAWVTCTQAKTCKQQNASKSIHLSLCQIMWRILYEYSLWLVSRKQKADKVESHQPGYFHETFSSVGNVKEEHSFSRIELHFTCTYLKRIPRKLKAQQNLCLSVYPILYCLSTLLLFCTRKVLECIWKLCIGFNFMILGFFLSLHHLGRLLSTCKACTTQSFTTSS